jgi:hypothetical protein
LFAPEYINPLPMKGAADKRVVGGKKKVKIKLTERTRWYPWMYGPRGKIWFQIKWGQGKFMTWWEL